MLYFVLSGLKETKIGAIGPVATKHKKDLSKFQSWGFFTDLTAKPYAT